MSNTSSDFFRECYTGNLIIRSKIRVNHAADDNVADEKDRYQKTGYDNGKKELANGYLGDSTQENRKGAGRYEDSKGTA